MSDSTGGSTGGEPAEGVRASDAERDATVERLSQATGEGRLTLERFVDLTSHGQQRIFGLADKGRIAEGYDADLTIVDLKARRTLRHADMATRSGWTPFDGMAVKGWPMATIIRGTVVMRDDEIIAPSRGEPVRFLETLGG